MTAEDNALTMTLKGMKPGSLVLFGLGESMFPLCGKTAFAIEALEVSGVAYAYINVLSNKSLEDGRRSLNLPDFPLLFSGSRLLAGDAEIRRAFLNDAMAKLVAA